MQKKHIPESLFKTVTGVGAKKRTPMPEMEVAERIKSFDEADLVISEEDAKFESNRCLNCCRLCYNPDPDRLVEVAIKEAVSEQPAVEEATT